MMTKSATLSHLSQKTNLSKKQIAEIFDVDGVLTDGRLFIGEQGESFKAFHVLDGQGLKLLMQGGIVPLIVTGRDSPAVRRRAWEMGVELRFVTGSGPAGRVTPEDVQRFAAGALHQFGRGPAAAL